MTVRMDIDNCILINYNNINHHSELKSEVRDLSTWETKYELIS